MPAVKPFAVMLLTDAVPLAAENCVRPLVPKFKVTLPTLSPFTVKFGIARVGEVGDVNWPLELNVKDVPVFCHATWLPVAVVSV